MSNPISDPGLTAAECRALLEAAIHRAPTSGTSEWKELLAGKAKLEAALSAPEEDNSGVEKAVEELAKRLYRDACEWKNVAPAHWDHVLESIKNLYRQDARGHLAIVRPLLTQQPVLLSDEDRKGRFEFRVNDHAGIHGPLDRDSAKALKRELAEADPPPPREAVIESRWVDPWRPEVEADAHHCGNCGVRSRFTLTAQCHKCGAPDYGHVPTKGQGER